MSNTEQNSLITGGTSSGTVSSILNNYTANNSSNSLLNCYPGLWWGSTPTYIGEFKNPVENMSIEFVSNGFILLYNGHKYVAPNLKGLFTTIGDIIEEKLEAAKIKKKESKK